MTNSKINQTAHYQLDNRCVKCQFRSFERLMNKFELSDEQRQRFTQFYDTTMQRVTSESSPLIHKILNDEFCSITGAEDLYLEEKRNSNRIAGLLYEEYKPKVFQSLEGFIMALRLSIAGNIMDYGAADTFDIHKTIDRVLHSDFGIDQSSELQKRIREAGKILYLGDNNGEIVFDKLFIEYLNHKNLTFVVRGSAVLNDVTIENAREVGMTEVANVITNGYGAPSTVLEKSSEEFLRYYREADLIISKGQGNFEGLQKENDPRIFFLMMVKCDVISEKTGAPKGSYIVYNRAQK